MSQDASAIIAEAGRLAEIQRLDEALSLLEPLRGLPDAEFRRGGLLMLLERFSEAEAAYRIVMAANPRHLATAIGYSMSLIGQGKGREALPYLDAAIRVDPNSGRFRYLRSVALDDAGRRVEGAADLRAARNALIRPAENRGLVPWEVHVQLSRRCNLRCAMCGHEVWQSNAGFMEPDVFARVLDECVANKVDTLNILSGQGEPLLHPRALDMMEEAVGRGLKVGIVTNGTPLNAKRIERLAGMGLAFVQFSFAGWDKESYESVYVGAKFEKALENLEALDAALPHGGPTKFFVKAVARGDWKTTLERTRAFLGSRGIGRVITVIANNFGGNVQCGTWSEKHQVWSQKTIEHHRRMPCRLLLKSVGVFCDGTVTACGCYDSNAELRIGHIMESGLRDIRNGERFRALLEAFRSGDVSGVPMCGKCDDIFG